MTDQTDYLITPALEQSELHGAAALRSVVAVTSPVVGGAISGATAGALLGSVIPVYGTIFGAAIGGILGAKAAWPRSKY